MKDDYEEKVTALQASCVSGLFALDLVESQSVFNDA